MLESINKNHLKAIKSRLDKLEKIIHRSKPGQISTQFFESLIGKEVVLYIIGDDGVSPVIGTLISFDEFTFLISFEDYPNTIYFKHAIETISQKPIL